MVITNRLKELQKLPNDLKYQGIEELIDLLHNIKVIKYSAVVSINGVKERVTGQIAINTEMDEIWQVECHIITKYKVEKFHDITTHPF